MKAASRRLLEAEHAGYPFCAPQRMNAEIPAAVHIGGSRMPCELRALAVYNETHLPWPAEPSRVPGGPTPAVRNWGSKCSRSSMNDSSGVAGMPISARPVGDGFVEPDLLGEAACLTRPGSVVRDGTSDRRACSWVSPSRQWLRSLALLVGERLELCPFRDEVGDQHGCCSGPGTGSRRVAGPRPVAADQGAIRGTFCR